MAKRKTTKKELFEIIEMQKVQLQYLKENYVEPYQEEVEKKMNEEYFCSTGFFVSDIDILDCRLEKLETLRKELNKYGKKRKTKK